MKRATGLWLVVVAATCAAAHGPPDGAASASAEARYIGNEGVLVSRGEHKVLFDAFYVDGYDQYVVPDSDTRKAILEGQPPYDGIDAVFVSHVHGDHFTAAPTLAYLRAWPEVRLFGPSEMLDALARAGAEPELLERVGVIDLAPGDPPQKLSINGVDIDVVAIPHAGGARMASVRNLVFRVTIEGLSTVLHFGDAGADEAEFRRQQEHWKARHVHTAFPPYWFLGDETGVRVLDDYIRADHVIGIHVPAAAIGDGDAWREQYGGDLFTDPGESRPVGAPE